MSVCLWPCKVQRLGCEGVRQFGNPDRVLADCLTWRASFQSETSCSFIVYFAFLRWLLPECLHSTPPVSLRFAFDYICCCQWVCCYFSSLFLEPMGNRELQLVGRSCVCWAAVVSNRTLTATIMTEKMMMTCFQQQFLIRKKPLTN